MQNSMSSSYTPSAMIYNSSYRRLFCGSHDENLGPGISDYLFSTPVKQNLDGGKWVGQKVERV